MSYFFTSESVTEGHPDKICDQISDAILDATLQLDPNARVACEVAVTTGMALIFGEITAKEYPDVQSIARNTIKKIGYDRGKYGYDSENVAVLVTLNRQSPDIALGVDRDGAGDQGIMFGYATNETPEYMPLPIVLAHKLAIQLAKVRKDGTLSYLRPDGKTQVTIEYNDDGTVKRIDTVLLSTQHSELVTLERIKTDVKRFIFDQVLPQELIDENTKYLVNPTGRFVVGGPYGDSGLTGRKIIVDTYGGYARHGGGCFSGKDPSKVDRSGSYAARYVAKNIVAAGLADRCEIQLSYAIGIDKPVSIFIETFGTNKVPNEKIIDAVKEKCPLTPKWIINQLNLRRPIYQKTASYGHFGRDDIKFPWEELNIVDYFRKLL